MAKSDRKSRKRKIIVWLVAVLGIIVLGGVIIMYLQERKPEPRRVTCVNNLKQIGMFLSKYAETHNGKIPDSLKVLPREVDLAPEILQCPATNGNPSDDRIDYNYVAGGVNLAELDNNTILAYHRDPNHPRKSMNVLFPDDVVNLYDKGEVRGYKVKGFEVESIDELLKRHEELHMPDTGQ